MICLLLCRPGVSPVENTFMECHSILPGEVILPTPNKALPTKPQPAPFTPPKDLFLPPASVCHGSIPVPDFCAIDSNPSKPGPLTATPLNSKRAVSNKLLYSVKR